MRSTTILRYVLGWMVVVCIYAAGPLGAQPVSNSLDALAVTTADGLDTMVYMPASEMPVGEALQRLASSTGIDIAYGSHVVPTGRRVEFADRRGTARKFLRDTLRDTNLAWVRQSPEQIVIVSNTAAGTSEQQVQEGTIRGVVKDRATGEPMPGVNVVLPSLNTGSATKADGTYEISEVPPGEYELTARFVGYETLTKTIEVAEEETITVNFLLRPSQMEMEEVVVTGTGGNARRREVGNSISKVDEGEIDESVATFGDVLQGQAAGVSVLTNSGQIGAGRTIRLRGNSSLSQGNSPLIYVDGIRVQNQTVGHDIEVNQTANVLDDIDPSNIKSIEVIKGPAATTLYGSEASSGVIQIFTKKGSEGSPRINFSTKQGVEYLGQVGTQDVHSELSVNDCGGESGCPGNGDWLKPGHTHQYNLSVGGGTGKVNYYLSGEWEQRNGAFDADQSSDSYSVRGNFDFNPSKTLNVEFQSFYSRREIDWIPDGNNADGLLLNSLRGDQAPVPDESQILEMDLNTNTDHFTTGVTVNWSPWKNVNQSLNVGLDYSLSEYIEERPFGYVREPQGNRENQTEIDVVGSLDYSGSAEIDLTESISTSTSWGGQLFREVNNSVEVFGEDFSGIGDKVVTSGAQTEVRDEDRIVTYTGGLFAQERLGWKDRLFVTLGLRVDGSSTFGDDFGLAPYPKASVSYLISEQTFWPDWWETLKLRAAYGESGRLPGPFDAERTFDSVPGENGRPGLSPGNPGNANLGPERSREFEAGIEWNMWDSRVSGSFTGYRQRTYDAIVDVQQTPSLGVPGDVPENVGKLAAEGIELDLDLGVVQNGAVSWRVGGSFSVNQTEALDLNGEEVYIGWDQEVREGSAVPSFYGNELKNPDQIPENPQNIQYKDELQDLGPTYPKREFSVNTSVTLWGDLTVEALGGGKYGHVLSAGTARENAERGIWPGCSDIVNQINNGDYSGLTARQIGRCDPQQVRDGQWVFPADFFRLRSLSLEYQVPETLLPSTVRNLQVRVRGRNLFVLTDYPGLDPEAYEDGASSLYRQEYYNLPPTKSVTFSLQVGL